jgi:hypothetical protein
MHDDVDGALGLASGEGDTLPLGAARSSSGLQSVVMPGDPDDSRRASTTPGTVDVGSAPRLSLDARFVER